MIDLLKYILANIVSHPQDLNIEEIKQDELYTYKIKARDEDNGKIIGKQGKIIQSLRNICKILAIKQAKQIRIELA